MVCPVPSDTRIKKDYLASCWLIQFLDVVRWYTRAL